MTASILKQMGIQAWRLRQTEPVPAVESRDVESKEHQEFNGRYETEEAFDPNQMWSNEPEAHDGLAVADTSTTRAAPTIRPLSQGMGLGSKPDQAAKANTNRIAKPSVDTNTGDTAKPVPAPLPKLMPAPAPIAEPAHAVVIPDQDPEAVVNQAPAVVIDKTPEGARGSNSHDLVSHLDWQGLQALIDQQNYCQTCSSASSILGSGDANADWMFVTDAPSRDDLTQQQLFSGRAGQLYEAMLHAVGLDRTAVYTSSVFKCTAPADQSLSPNCDKLLRRQIELVQPKVIISFGEFASQSVLRSNESLEVLRTQQSMCYQTQTPVVATYSPAQLLEQSNLKAGAWQDLKKCLAIDKSAKLD